MRQDHPPVDSGSSATPPQRPSAPLHAARWSELPGRTFLPLLVLTLLLGTVLWGPWVGLVLAVVAWQLAGRVW